MNRAMFGCALALLTTSATSRAIEPDEAPSPAPTAAPPAPTVAPAPPPAGPPPAPPTGGGAPPPLEPPPDAYAPGAGRPDQAPPQMTGGEEAEEDDGGEGRFRGGVGGLVGAFFPGSVLQIGPEGRLGYQIDDLMAVYASFGAHAGAGFNVDETSSSVSLGAAVFGSPMFEVTLVDIFFVGLGPQFLYGSFVTADAASSGQNVGTEVSAFAGFMPGFKLKTGVGFGSDAPDRRKQFTIALDLSVVFGDRLRVTTSDGTVDAGVAVGVLPMLAIGYDAK